MKNKMLNIFGKKSSPAQKADAENKSVKPTAENNGPARRSLGEGGRRLEGVVVSDKMKKTVVIAITTLKLQPKYRKYFKVTKRFKAHDENNEYKVGDKVIIRETKPMSKEKRWVVISRQ